LFYEVLEVVEDCLLKDDAGEFIAEGARSDVVHDLLSHLAEEIIRMNREKQEETLKARREAILAIAEKYGVLNVRIFGSVACGEADDESDLDLLVEPMPGFTLLKSSAMTRELEGLLGRRVDVVSERGLRERIRDRVLKDAIPL